MPPGALRILITDSLHQAGIDWLYQQGAEVSVLAPSERSRLVQRAAEFDALIIRTVTRVDAELFDAAPRIRVVGRAGAGVDNIDVDAARARGVKVVNAPDANVLAAAEHTFALLLALARRLPEADASLKAGAWVPGSPLGLELAGRTLGIVGFGRIGQRVARRALAFEMEVVINDIAVDQDAVESLGVGVVPVLDDLLERIDVLSLHTPLDQTTLGLIDRERLHKLRRGALVVNCARGGIVDEAALLETLESGHLGGAALDVFTDEPLVDFRLAAHPRVVATPHLGAHTVEAKRRVGLEIAQRVIEALKR